MPLIRTFLLLSIATLSFAIDNLSISRTSPYGDEHISFFFHSNKIMIHTNSNFIDPYSPKVFLGSLESISQYPKELKRLDQLLFSAKKSKELVNKMDIKSEIPFGNDAIQISLDNIRISANANYWDEIYKIGQKILAFSKWKINDGIEFDVKNLPDTVKCNVDLNKLSHCFDSQWGHLYFRGEK